MEKLFGCRGNPLHPSIEDLDSFRKTGSPQPWFGTIPSEVSSALRSGHTYPSLPDNASLRTLRTSPVDDGDNDMEVKLLSGQTAYGQCARFPSVLDLKLALEEVIKIPASNQRLIHQARMCDDDEPVHIGTYHLVTRLRGGTSGWDWTATLSPAPNSQCSLQSHVQLSLAPEEGWDFRGEPPDADFTLQGLQTTLYSVPRVVWRNDGGTILLWCRASAMLCALLCASRQVCMRVDGGSRLREVPHWITTKVLNQLALSLLLESPDANCWEEQVGTQIPCEHEVSDHVLHCIPTSGQLQPGRYWVHLEPITDLTLIRPLGPPGAVDRTPYQWQFDLRFGFTATSDDHVQSSYLNFSTGLWWF